ncbi:helix-turn-helix domain-containing protein [Micromonospora sp. DSM 115977]|uniref:Helix-turn-helix domain-containing protein n=1 Tax=Micromonospora reichwaldensis TaxID=3075516 RepID=A0ABU2X1R0_9ACTN|nr:helix-turn-helix domain-containing protein [Micromonospora sp. DSM 115977]MDT0532124.1 helix-turn-helix domain-containing protein [Micromonospora sp. DSM 115977]
MSTTTTGGRKPSQALDQVWTIAAVRELGVTTDVETAGAILGIGRTKAYELAKTNEFPVRLLRVGRRYLVPVPAILKLLAIE